MVELKLEGGVFSSMEFIPIDFGPEGVEVKEIKGKARENFMEYLEYISGILINDTEAMKYWKAWCLMKGPWWVSHFNKVEYPVDRNNKDSLIASLVMRNGHTCEAHNELLTSFWKMTAHGDTEGYEEYIGKIENLQKSIIPKD